MTNQEKINHLKELLENINNDVVIERNDKGYPIKEMFYSEGFYLMQVKKNHNPRSIDLNDWSQKKISPLIAVKYYDELIEELEVNAQIYNLK